MKVLDGRALEELSSSLQHLKGMIRAAKYGHAQHEDLSASTTEEQPSYVQ